MVADSHKLYDIAIVGAGSAGVMASHIIFNSCSKLSVALLEKEKRPLRKFKIAGKGRCNLTNNISPDLFLSVLGKKSKFLHSSFSRFNNRNLIYFFNKLGIETKVERGNRVFPVSDSAMSMAISFFDVLLKKYPIDFINNFKVKNIIKNGESFEIKSNDSTIFARKLLITTGGITYPLTGSDGSIFPILKRLGHNIVELRHALCGMKSFTEDINKLAGLALKNCMISIYSENKKVYGELGELLFTGSGVSGPIILKLSRLHRELFYKNGKAKGNVEISIDLKPALDLKKLENRFLREIEKSPTKIIGNVIGSFGPNSLIEVISNRISINREV